MSRATTHITMEQVRATYKVRDSWWTVLLVDPIVGPLVRLTARYRWITPNRLTITAFLLGLGAATAYLTSSPMWLVVGVLGYHLGFMIDCMDGKIARLNHSGSIFGGWLDFVLDRVRVLLCVVAVFAGGYQTTGDSLFLFAAIAVVFLALFGYVNGGEIDKAWKKLTGVARPAPAEATVADAAGQPDLLQAATGRAAGPLGRLRAGLHRRRIRMNLVSGIEFEMAVLVIAPLLMALTGPYALLWVTAASAGLLLLFEAALIYRFWVATRTAARVPAPTSAPATLSAPSALSGGAADLPQPRRES